MTEHYFSEEQTSKLVKREWALEVSGRRLFFETASGTFSPRKLDIGTRALLKYMVLPSKGKLLDLGCGNGIIGIVAAAEEPGLEVFMSDVNERAIAESRTNVRRNKLKAKVIKSDLFEKIDDKFDCIISNPPISAGRKTVFAMVEQGFEHLNVDGNLQMVARKTKGGDMLSKEMKRVFGNVDDIGRKSGFHIYKSVKSE